MFPRPARNTACRGIDRDLPGYVSDPSDFADVSDEVSEDPVAPTDLAPGMPGLADMPDPANVPGAMWGSQVPGHSGLEFAGSEGQGGMGSGDVGANSGNPGDPDSGTGNNSGDESGMMRGGYTGSGADLVVQPWREAGVTVHEGELVLPAHRVAQLAPETLLSLVGPGANWRNMAQTSRLAQLAGLA